MKNILDKVGAIPRTPVTEEYVDRVMGCLADGPDLLAKWEIEHREEGEHDFLWLKG